MKFHNWSIIIIAICLILQVPTTRSARRQGRGDSLSGWWRTFTQSYPKYKATTSILKEMERQFPTLVKLYSIGRSVNGLEIWVINIAEDVHLGRPLMRPMVKIVANMHGDEALGRALSLMLATYLVSSYRAKTPRVVQLLRTTDIHLLFSLNPDGFEVIRDGDCWPDHRRRGRRNYNEIDLNRNFPDQYYKHTPKPEAETIHAMNWIRNNPFVLSANLHGGALVASYPFDSLSPQLREAAGKYYPDRGIPSLSPDNAFFVYLAKLYSNAHKEMHLGRYGDTGACESEAFPGGITNGADWYNVPGGMQDFNYVHSNCFEITFELSCCKIPSSRELVREWDNNKEALLQFLEATHMGIKGVVAGSRSGTKILIDGIDKAITTTDRGEYWRLLVPGTYTVSVVVPGGYRNRVFRNIHVSSNFPTVLNHTLH